MNAFAIATVPVKVALVAIERLLIETELKLVGRSLLAGTGFAATTCCATILAVLVAAAFADGFAWFPNGISAVFGMRGDAISVATKDPSCCNDGESEPEKNCGISCGIGGAGAPLGARPGTVAGTSTGTQLSGTFFSSIKFGLSAIMFQLSIDQKLSCCTTRFRWSWCQSPP